MDAAQGGQFRQTDRMGDQTVLLLLIVAGQQLLGQAFERVSFGVPQHRVADKIGQESAPSQCDFLSVLRVCSLQKNIDEMLDKRRSVPHIVFT